MLISRNHYDSMGVSSPGSNPGGDGAQELPGAGAAPGGEKHMVMAITMTMTTMRHCCCHEHGHHHDEDCCCNTAMNTIIITTTKATMRMRCLQAGDEKP